MDSINRHISGVIPAYKFGNFNGILYHPTTKSILARYYKDNSKFVWINSYQENQDILDAEILPINAILTLLESHLTSGEEIFSIYADQETDPFFILRTEFRIYLQLNIFVPLNPIENIAYQYGLY